MKGSGEAIVPFARPGPGCPGCDLERGPIRRRWVDKGYSMSRSCHNPLGRSLYSSRLGSSGRSEAARLEWRFHWWRSPPGWRAGASVGDGPILLYPFLPCAGRQRWGGALPRFVTWSSRRSRIPWHPCGLVGLAWVAWGGWCLSNNKFRHTHFSARRESGAAVTRGDLTATAWKKAKTSL